MLGDHVQQRHRARPGQRDDQPLGGILLRIPAGDQHVRRDQTRQGDTRRVQGEGGQIGAQHAQRRVEDEEHHHAVLARIDADDGLTVDQQVDERVELFVEPGGDAVAEGRHEQTPDGQQREQGQDAEPRGPLRVARRVGGDGLGRRLLDGGQDALILTVELATRACSRIRSET